MCGRFTLAPASGRLFGPRFGLAEDVEIKPRWNVAPSTQIPVVSRRGERNQLDWMHWGLVPHWAKSPDGSARMINARAETVTEKPAYRGLLKSHRCLIPADGFYEWQVRGDGPKQPWLFTEPGGEVFGFAGLWTTWEPGDGVEPLESVTIITTEPNAVVAPVHKRMPVILPADLEERWIDPGTPADEAVALLGPISPELLEAWPVSTRVNSVRNDDVDCAAPVEPGRDLPAAGTQEELF